MTEPKSNLTTISEVQQQILHVIKQHGEATTASIAEQLQVSYEAIRQQIRQLEANQLIVASKQREDEQRLGVPPRSIR